MGKTTIPLRQFVFTIVDESLRGHYGDNYSDRCFQSSMAVQKVLRAIGVKADLRHGNVCMFQVLNTEPPGFGWAGFMQDDWHIWVSTEFTEWVDLTVSHLHLHPSASANMLPIPAVWWEDVAVWPSMMLYMPKGIPQTSFVEREDDDLKTFLVSLDAKLTPRLGQEIGENYDLPILHGPEHLQALDEEGKSLWLSVCGYCQDVPMPEWVQKYGEERQREYEEQQRAKK